MLNYFADFHFLRPAWFVALLPIVYLVWYLRHQKQAAEQWKSLIDPTLLNHLLDGTPSPRTKNYLWYLSCAWCIAVIALAGPVWDKRPVPIEKNANALVIALDLSPSMYSQDLKPSRLARARLKVIDALNERKDGQTALIAYAGDAHVVSPLTEDSNNIKTLLPNLAPEIMPLAGSNTEEALSRSFELINSTGLNQGEVLLVTDGIDEEATDTLTRLAQENPNIQVNILAVGTSSPTPIPSTRGGFVRDRSGNIVTTKIDVSQLAQIAKLFNGRFHLFTDDNRDIKALVKDVIDITPDTISVEREFDQWHEYSHWLVLLLLPAILYGFRRGALCLVLVGAAFIFTPQTSYASTLERIFLNKDQQGVRALEQGDATRAKDLFTDPQWRAAAEYKAGNYEEAAKLFNQGDSAKSAFNKGNALLHMGKLDEAIKAYDEALKKDPDFTDAEKNKSIAEALKKQQDEQQSDQQQNEDSSSDDQKNQDSENSDSSDQKSSSDSKEDSSDQEQSGSQDPQDSQDDAESQQSQSSQDSQDSQNSPNSQESSSEADQGESAEESQQSSSQHGETGEQESSDATEQNELGLTPITSEDDLTQEEREALEMRLRQVPDDPGLLLRNKFKHQHGVRRQKMFNGEWSAPDNGAADRW